MGFKEIIQNIGSKNKERKEMIKQMSDQIRFQKLVEDRQKSSNQRELEGYYEEDKQAQIKEALESARKKRDYDIKFNHNPINAKNITNSTQWEVLKEKNQFSGRSNMFEGQANIHKSNKSLLNNGNILKHQGNILKNQGGLI